MFLKVISTNFACLKSTAYEEFLLTKRLNPKSLSVVMRLPEVGHRDTRFQQSKDLISQIKIHDNLHNKWPEKSVALKK